jgi:hypothetical protein
MTRPLPELVTRSRRAWQITPPTHDPHTPNATPKTRRASGDTERTDPTAHASRILGLVAAKYNTRRPERLAQIVKRNTGRNDAAELLNAAQELQNRHLAQIVRHDLPQPRYCLPEQLASHHTHAPTSNRLGYDLAALIHKPDDLATYLAALRRLNATELADTAENLTSVFRRYLDALTDALATNPRRTTKLYERYDTEKNQTVKLRAKVAEESAIDLAQTLAVADERMTNARKRDEKDRRKRARQKRAKERQRERQQETGTTIPDDGELSGWYPVIPNKPPREIAHTGRLGRRRISTNAGKNPNRIANYYADPQRRIFTRKTRGTNALIVFDVSGSMNLDTDDLDRIMKSSSGATVVAYSSNGDDEPNTHLVAHESRRVRNLPNFAGGNGIDAPALLWAIKNYRKQNAPVLWITDGGVTGIGDHSNRNLRAQCHKLAKRYGVTIAPNVATALTDLDLLKTGKRPPGRLNTLTK